MRTGRMALAALGVSAALLAGRAGAVAPRLRTGGSSISTGVIQEDPELIREQMRTACRARIAQAQAALAEGQLIQASRQLNIARGLAVDAGLAAELSELYRRLNQAGQEQIDQADRQYAAGHYLDALRVYQTVMTAMAQLPAGQAASRRLDEAEMDPNVRSAAQEVKAAGFYQTVLGRVAGYWAAKHAPATQPVEEADPPPADPARPDEATIIPEMPVESVSAILQTLRTIVRHYGESPTAAKAARLLKSLESNPVLLAAVKAYEDEQAVKAQYERAKLYQDNRLYRQAAEYYRKLIEEHPAGPWTLEARKGLAQVEAILETTPAGK